MPPLKSLTERNRHGGLKQFVINFPVEKLKKANFFFPLFRLFRFSLYFFPELSISFPLPQCLNATWHSFNAKSYCRFSFLLLSLVCCHIKTWPIMVNKAFACWPSTKWPAKLVLTLFNMCNKYISTATLPKCVTVWTNVHRFMSIRLWR